MLRRRTGCGRAPQTAAEDGKSNAASEREGDKAGPRCGPTNQISSQACEEQRRPDREREHHRPRALVRTACVRWRKRRDGRGKRCREDHLACAEKDERDEQPGHARRDREAGIGSRYQRSRVRERAEWAEALEHGVDRHG